MQEKEKQKKTKAYLQETCMLIEMNFEILWYHVEISMIDYLT